MKILIVTPSWPPVAGGVARFSASLVRELRRLDSVEVRILTESGRSEPGVRVLGPGRASFVRSAPRILEEERPDVVHAHGHWYALWTAMGYRRRHPESRLIFSFHTDWEKMSRARRRFLSALLGRCDFITFVSWAQAERMVSRLRILAPYLVIPPGGDTEGDRSASAEPGSLLDLSTFRPLVLTVVPLQYEAKALGVAALLDAWPKVVEHHPRAGLVIAGDGAHRDALEARCRSLGVERSVRFLGAVASTTPLLRVCDVYVHASFQEGMPLALVEAMYHGRPIVATRAGGISEALADGECGLLVYGTPEGLARAIESLLDDPARAAELGERARARAHARYTWRAAAAMFESLYGFPGSSRIHVSVDVESDYMPPGLPRTYRGVSEGLPRLLDMLARHRIKASVFLTEDCLARFPELTGQLEGLGHTVGSHALHGQRGFGRLPRREQAALLERTAAEIARATSRRPRAFRAPNFDARQPTFQELVATGYSVDCSFLPGRRVRRWGLITRLDHRGIPLTPYRTSMRHPERPGRGDIVEIPVSPNPLSPGGPVGLGFLNAYGTEAALRALDRSPGRRAVFLIHPWEAVEYLPHKASPAWVSKACSADLVALDGILGQLAREGRIATFEQELQSADPARDPEAWIQSASAEYLRRRKVSVLVVAGALKFAGGDVSKYVEELRGGLLSHRLACRVIAIPPRLSERLSRRPASPAGKFLASAFIWYALAQGLAERLRRRVVIVHSQGSTDGLLASSILRCVGGRAVHTIHAPFRDPSRLVRWLLPRLDAVIATSKETWEECRKIPRVFNDRVAIAPGSASRHGALEKPPQLTGRAAPHDHQHVQQADDLASKHIAIYGSLL